MSAPSVTDVPEEIRATKTGGGGASPLPRLRAFLGSSLLGVQARSGSPVRDVPQPTSGGAMQVDVPSSCGTKFPCDAPYSGRACAGFLEDARSEVTDALPSAIVDASRGADMAQSIASVDAETRNFDVATGFGSLSDRPAPLGVPSDRSERSVSALGSCMLDVSTKTDHQQSVSHTSITTTKQDHFKPDQFSGLAEQSVPAGPDHAGPLACF